MQHFPNLDKAVNMQDDSGGIDLKRQKIGLKIVVETDDDIFDIVLVDIEKNPVVQLKSRQWKNPIQAVFTGSTWGGSTIRTAWIGQGMCMEFWLAKHKRITTKMVRRATLFIPCSDSEPIAYEMEWNNEAAN